ncbi:Minor endoglucanase Y precursor [Hartmannibacter diazotrophicus]|uniref:Glucanase n=1 Tax=Hartmannibacter diazotrophicus TaxID=1482074 RepID=A0A2C9DCV1_9HYPH|nr:glycosyl hydrolase family 8 [Hartmannibacter diazotrophicus]SON58086.1 Minor endoglucanase Y precursor [Hartmannibacter diazotrophicus]
MTRRQFMVSASALLMMAATGGFFASGIGQASGSQETLPVPRLDDALWQQWRGRFVTEEGRVLDDSNGDISHTEGQGYGMLLAAFADDRATFDRLWHWTKTTLGVRGDGLFAWRYDPREGNPISDPNNATDGDLLIAWALGAAHARWERNADLLAGAAIARAVIRHAIVEGEDGPLLLPAVSGFTAKDRPDGPVVNLSYWVFPAFPRLAEMVPEYDWQRLAASGHSLIRKARFGANDLPAEWTALGGKRMRPANGFDPVFGYNAVRVPLYLAMAGFGAFGGNRADLAPFDTLWPSNRVDPSVVDLLGRSTRSQPFGSSGYRAVPSLVRCALRGEAYPADLTRFEEEPYYPATLRLLAYVGAQLRYPECF